MRTISSVFCFAIASETAFSVEFCCSLVVFYFFAFSLPSFLRSHFILFSFFFIHFAFCIRFSSSHFIKANINPLGCFGNCLTLTKGAKVSITIRNIVVERTTAILSSHDEERNFCILSTTTIRAQSFFQNTLDRLMVEPNGVCDKFLYCTFSLFWLSSISTYYRNQLK